MRQTFLSIIGALFFILPLHAFAANIVLESSSVSVRPEQLFTVRVMLDPEGDAMNAIEGELIFPSELLAVSQVKDGDSFVSFWIESPTASLLRDGQTAIHFSGIVPGGYQGEKGTLFSIDFRGIREGDSTLSIRSLNVLRSDGKGTPLPARSAPLAFRIIRNAPAIAVATESDDEPPEPFTPLISRQQGMLDGRYFMVFSTRDKGMGVDHYEVREGDSPWVRAESPYVFKNQDLDAPVFVKAVDRAGYERVAMLSPLLPRSVWMPYAALALLALFVYHRIRKLRRKK